MYLGMAKWERRALGSTVIPHPVRIRLRNGQLEYLAVREILVLILHLEWSMYPLAKAGGRV